MSIFSIYFCRLKEYKYNMRFQDKSMLPSYTYFHYEETLKHFGQIKQIIWINIHSYLWSSRGTYSQLLTIVFCYDSNVVADVT